MKGKLLILTIVALVLAAAGATTAQAHRLSGHPESLRAKLALAKRQYWHDQQQIEAKNGFRHWVKRDQTYVQRLTSLVWTFAFNTSIPHKSAWLCIHSYEGSWTDSGDPYWGGLQMDRSFMYTYGSDMIRRYGGFANVWPPTAQMAVAERAYRSRGYTPWPNTARFCGLL